MHATPPFNPHQASSLLWGFSLDEAVKVLVPAMITGSVISTLAFAVITIFARKWRIGLVILGIGLIFEAIPTVAVGIRTGATLAEVVAGVVKIWFDLIPFLLIFFGSIAWLMRKVWDELGRTFEMVLNRWGVGAPILIIVGCLILYVTIDAGLLFARHS